MAIDTIVKRDGKVVEFQPKKITQAIFKAMHSSGIGDIDDAEKFTGMVLKSLEDAGGTPTVEDVQDIVIKMLLNEGIGGKRFSEVAESYILYRENRRKIREEKQRLSEKSIPSGKGQVVLEQPRIDLRLRPTTVTNRKGERVPIDVGKIRSVVMDACDGLTGVDPLLISWGSKRFHSPSFSISL